MMKRQKGFIQLKNKYACSTLYDIDNNSFMPRYRLWMEYKDYCKHWGWKPMSVKEFGEIIHKSQKAAADEIISNPEGVKFFKFKIKLIFVKTSKGWVDKHYFPFLKIEPLTKSSGIFRIKHFRVEMKKLMMKRVTAYFRANPTRILEYEIGDWKSTTIIEDDDLFNDF